MFIRLVRKVYIILGEDYCSTDSRTIEIYFYADVGNETYDIRDFVEPEPAVWRGLIKEER